MRFRITVLSLVVALVLTSGCTLMHREPEPPPPPASDQLLAQADEAWQAHDHAEARRLYGMIIESFAGDPNRQLAFLRLALLEIDKPGEGPDVAAARAWLERMDPAEMSAGEFVCRDALFTLFERYETKREATRMLAAQNRRLEAQVAGRELEATRQKAALYQWRKDVGRANDRAQQLEVELEKLRQEIKLLKDIDMMLQTEEGDKPPPADQAPAAGQKRESTSGVR